VKDIVQSLVRYVEVIAGIAPKLQSAPAVLQKLPMYLGSLYEVWKGDLLDQHYLFFLLKRRTHLTPAEVAGHYRVVTRELVDPIAFVFDDLESFARQRLVRYRVPFVVPGRQMYLPVFLIDLRERARGQTRRASEGIKHLSGPAQVLLLHYLQKKGAPKLCSLREWAGLLGYSAMTATRIAGELRDTRLCKVEQRMRKTVLDFDSDRHVLWEKALPCLNTPVRRRSYVRVIGKVQLSWLQAGIPALSHHSMLADDGHAVVAVSISEYTKALAEELVQEVPFPDEDALTVEHWRYRPGILSDGPTVDPLSLYLSLCEDPDGRVQGALNELLEGLQW
jgi:hypothetical protein